MPCDRQSGWLSPSDAARLLGVAPTTLERWVQAGRIPSELTQDGRRVLRRVEVLNSVLRPAQRQPPED